MYRLILPEELKLNTTLGYIYFIDKEHPLAHGKAKWVYYHRHVASIKLGRWITTDEIVHHIDENKANNVPDNLEVLNRSEHAKLHCPKELSNVVCPICSKEFSPKRWTQKYCSSACGHKSRELHIEVTKEYLEPLIWLNSMKSLESVLNMSDNGIKKLAIRLGCRMPPTRFHVRFPLRTQKEKEYQKVLL